MKKVRGYIFSRPFMGERVPQHVQNLVIRDYCERSGLHFLLSAAEYAMQNTHFIFEQVIGELTDIDGIVAYSLFQLPEDSARREIIYNQIVSMNKTLFFAVEGLKAGSLYDFEKIEMLWLIRQTLPNCIQSTI